MKKFIVYSLLALLFFLSGCQLITAPTPTSLPLTATPTQTITPSATPQPTETTIPTITNTPTATPIPGPLKITDDFTKKSDIWGPCPGCEWKDGKLFAGPYRYNDAPENLYRIVCEACGEPVFYRFGVTVQFIEGSGLDRGFGLLVHDSETRMLDLEITTGQMNIFFEFDYSTQRWRSMIDPKQYYRARLFPAYDENKLEVAAKPSNTKGKVDYEIVINNSVAYYIWSQPLEPGWVGLVVGWHGIGVSFDDFVFEDLPENAPYRKGGENEESSSIIHFDTRGDAGGLSG